MRTVAINIGIFLASILFALVGIELYLRIAQPYEMRLRGTEIRLPYYQTYELVNEETQDGKLDPHAVHSKNGLGFRGPNPPADFDGALTVLMVGGSTTEAFYIDDSKTWTHLTTQHLSPAFNNLWINNAGLDGHSSFGHLHLFDQHLAGLSPDVIVYLVGGNDMDGLIKRNRYDDTLSLQPELDPNRRNPVFREWIAKQSELAGLLLAMYERRKVDRVDGSSLLTFENYQQDVDTSVDSAVVALHEQDYLPAYEERIRLLLEKTIATGIHPILLTHPASFGYAGEVDPTTGIDLATIPYKGMTGATAWTVLERYNDVTRTVAGELGVDLIDLGRELPKDTKHFTDQIHFSIYGNEAIAGFLSGRLCQILVVAFPDYQTGSCPG